MVYNVSHNDIRERVNNFGDHKHGRDHPRRQSRLVCIKICQLSHHAADCIQCKLPHGICKIITPAHYFLNAKLIFSQWFFRHIYSLLFSASS